MYLLAAVILGGMIGGPVGSMIAVFAFMVIRVVYVLASRRQ